ncbi:hypothetical protein MHI39_19530 [Heyndrickxia sp. FSL K6-6286]|uniref:hypothetical protein n=1 Tax=Heyndrickxia sp. FSL K6-6286 TaxID=2921510 RepID=UPI0015D44D2B|nr:hypothetical protein [Bacillus sp. Gen3]
MIIDIELLARLKIEEYERMVQHKRNDLVEGNKSKGFLTYFFNKRQTNNDQNYCCA